MLMSFRAKPTAKTAKTRRSQRKSKFLFFLCALCGFAVFALVPSCSERGARTDRVGVNEALSRAMAATQPREFECRWTDIPITIDGHADEEAWKHAQSIDGFQISWAAGDARKPRTATKAKLLWDRDYLYFF